MVSEGSGCAGEVSASGGLLQGGPSRKSYACVTRLLQAHEGRKLFSPPALLQPSNVQQAVRPGISLVPTPLPNQHSPLSLCSPPSSLRHPYPPSSSTSSKNGKVGSLPPIREGREGRETEPGPLCPSTLLSIPVLTFFLRAFLPLLLFFYFQNARSRKGYCVLGAPLPTNPPQLAQDQPRGGR